MSETPQPPSRSVDLAGLSIMMAIPAHRDMHPQTVASIISTVHAIRDRGLEMDVEIDYGSSLVHHARSKMAWRFLQSKHNRLFWIDSDMVWEAKAFLRLLALSVLHPMVAGAYVAKQDPPLFMVKTGDLSAMPVNEFGLLGLDGLGLGFCVMQRQVLEDMAEHAPVLGYHQLDEPIPSLFRLDGVDPKGNAMGEDMAFFADAKELGYPLWVDPTPTLGHVGSKVYRGQLAAYLDGLRSAPDDETA